MTRQEARESAAEDRRMAELKEAYADGKTIELKHPDGSWRSFDSLHFEVASSYYRIKPEPVFSYWSKPEDVPVGRAVMRKKDDDSQFLITGATQVFVEYGHFETLFERLQYHEHAMIMPDGTLGPWGPCGKEEV